MKKDDAIKAYCDFYLAVRKGEREFEDIGETPVLDSYVFLKENGWKDEANNILDDIISKQEIEIENIKEEYYAFLNRGEDNKEEEKKFIKKIHEYCNSGKAEEEVKFRFLNGGRFPTDREMKHILSNRSISNECKILRYLELMLDQVSGKEISKKELSQLEDYLDDKGVLRIAKIRASKVLEDGYIEKQKRELEHRRRLKEASEAVDDLFIILKDFNIWKVGKFDEDLKETKEILRENDKNYVARTFLYKDLMKLPKYAKLEEDEKIVLAMKIGALDMQDLSYNKEI